MFRILFTTYFLLGLVTTLSGQQTGWTYYLESMVSSDAYILGARGNQNTNGTHMDLVKRYGLPGHKIIFEDAGGGYFYFRSGHGRYLHVQNVSSKPGAYVVLWDGRGGDNTKWRFIDDGGGVYRIQSKMGTWLDVRNGGTTPGTPIWLWSKNASNAQKWKLIKLPGGRVEDWKPVTVQLTGARMKLHNDDCRKLQGSLRARLYDLTTGKLVQAEGSDELLTWAGNKSTDFDKRNLKNPNVRSVTFRVNARTFATKKYAVQVYTDNLKGCHKSCDLCSDYNCNIRYSDSNQIHAMNFAKTGALWGHANATIKSYQYKPSNNNHGKTGDDLSATPENSNDPEHNLLVWLQMTIPFK